MMDEKEFDQLVDEIMAQGYDETTATRFAVIIGDTPTRDAAGNIVVMLGKKIIATLKPLKSFED